MENFEHEGVQIAVEGGSPHRVTFVGTMRSQDTAWLLPPLDRAMKIIAASAGDVVVDLRQLSFTNTPCFRVVTNWMREVLALSPRRRVKVLLDPYYLWQKVSLSTLKIIGAETDESGGR